MQQGVAVASSLSTGAGTALAGRDFVVKTDADIIPYVLAMVKDPQLLRKNKDAMLEEASKWGAKAYVDNLVACIEELVMEFEHFAPLTSGVPAGV